MNAKDLALRIPLALLALGVWLLVARDLLPVASVSARAQEAGAAAPRTLELDELVVKRLRVVEEDGKDRVVISNAARFPLPRLGGKEYPRSIAPGGMVFYRANGDECGGFGVVDTPQGTANLLIMDYGASDAIGFGVREAAAGGYSASLGILDRPPLGTPAEKAASLVHMRVALENDSGRGRLVLSDPAGRERIVLAVDEQGAPSIRILDEEGEPLFEAP